MSAIVNPGGRVEPTAGTPAVDYEPFLPDKKYHKTSPPELLTLTQEQETVYQEVLKHFSAEGYVTPDLKDGDGKLTEEEKFFLVSPCYNLLVVYPCAEDLNRVQTYECFLRWVNGECFKSHTLDAVWTHSLDSFEPQSGTRPSVPRNSKPLSSGDVSTEFTTPSRSSLSKNTYVPLVHVRYAYLYNLNRVYLRYSVSKRVVIYIRV
jgi:hypothetical protein